MGVSAGQSPSRGRTRALVVVMNVMCQRADLLRLPENPTCCVICGELPEFLKGFERDKHGVLFTADEDEVSRQLLRTHNFIKTDYVRKWHE